MKSVFTIKIILTTLFSSFFAFVQAAGVETTTFEVNGLKVIHRNSVKDIVSVRLFVKGGVNNYPAAQAGIETLAFDLATSGGTTTLDKVAFASALNKIGTSISGSSGRDYGSLNLTCLVDYWDKSWDLFADAVLNPAMPEDHFMLLQQQMLATARQSTANADSYLKNLIYSNAFENTAYSIDPEGSKTSIPTLTLEAVKTYYASLIGKNRCFLVVVGKISDADLKSKIEATLAHLPEGEAVEIKGEIYTPEAGFMVEQRALPTNYIAGLMSAPLVSSDNYVPNQLAMNMLYDRFFTELRTKRSLSYAPSASYVNLIQHPYNRIYITTSDPKLSMEVMTAIIDSVKAEGFDAKELKNKKLTFMTYHYMGMERNEAISRALGRYEIINSWKLFDEWPEKVNTAELEAINSVIDTYCKAIYWIYLGNEDLVVPEDFVQLK